MLKVQSRLCFKDLPQRGKAPGWTSSSLLAVSFPQGSLIEPREPRGDFAGRGVALGGSSRFPRMAPSALLTP